MVKIGRGESADVASLRLAWAGERGGVAATQLDRNFVEEVEQWMADESRTVWTAHEEGRAVGMVCLTEFQRMPSPWAQASGSWGYLGHLYVRPEARGKGVGALLIDTVLGEARARRYGKVLLSPTEESAPLYRRCGFGDEHGLLLWRP